MQCVLFRVLCIALALLASHSAYSTGDALPRLTRASIAYGRAPRLPANAWAHVHFTVENPTKRPVDVRIVFRPDGQRNITIYESELTVPAGQRFQAREPVTVGTVTRYVVEMYYDGNLITTEQFPVEIADPKRRMVWLANDNSELSYGSFVKNKNLNGRYGTVFISARSLPTHWSGYDRAHMVVLFQPSFNQMTTRQFDALLNYIGRGGTVVFGDPVGIQRAMTTPLRKFLPVTPLRIRPLDETDAFRALGGNRLSGELGIEFLEATPRGDGVTTVHHGEFPVVRWSRRGLGTIGVCTINPSLEAVKATGNFDRVWRHLLHYGGRQRYVSSHASRDTTQALDAMTGLSIPRPRQIRRILLAYVITVGVCIGIGVILRRRLASWLALAVLSVFATIAIFRYASRLGSSQPGAMATVIEFAMMGSETSGREQLVSLFSKQEKVVDIVGGGTDTKLRNVIPPGRVSSHRIQAEKSVVRSAPRTTSVGNGADITRGVADAGQNEVIREPLTVSVRNGTNAITNLLLRGRASRFYSVLDSGGDESLESLPTVRWEATGPRLAPWAIPSGDESVLGAALLCEGGAFPATVKDGYCSVESESNGAPPALATESEALLRFLNKTPMPVPALAVLTPAGSNATTSVVPGGFNVMGCRVSVYPVQQELGELPIRIPFERMPVMPADAKVALRLMQDGQWREIIQHGQMDEYSLRACLPPGFNMLAVDTIHVRFEAENRGRNLQFDVALVLPSGEIVEPTRRDKLYYVFERGDVEVDVVERSQGCIQIVLRAATREYLRDPMDRQRVNAWSIRSFDASVEGRIPPAYRGTL